MRFFETFNFPINDDWVYYRQVEHFMSGKPGINTFIDSSFILQGWLGAAWSWIFGLSFNKLWVLTIIFTALLLVCTHLILKHFGVGRNLRILTLITIGANPLVLTSSFTFMTDMYFLAFFVWSVYFYVRYFSEEKTKYLVLGSLFCALSVLIRQVGVVLIMAFVLAHWKTKLNLRGLLYSGLIVSGALLILFLWPRYEYTTLLRALIQIDQLPKRFEAFAFSVIYFSFFMSPLLYLLMSKLTSRVRNAFLAIMPFIVYVIYQFDIFPVGAIFYVEGFHLKSDFRSSLSIFDNSSFKAVLSIYIAFAVLLFLYFIFVASKETLKRRNPLLFLVILSLGTLGSLVVVNDFYDRYLLPTLISLILLFFTANLLKDEVAGRLAKTLSVTGIVFMTVFSIFHQYDYIRARSIIWKQAFLLQEHTGQVTGIYVDDVYTKYVYAKRQGDYVGVHPVPPGLNYKCYVQKYTVDSGSGFNRWLSAFEDKIERKIPNPRIYESRKKPIKRIKNHLRELLYNEEYPSPAFNLVGKRVFVGSWCDSL